MRRCGMGAAARPSSSLGGGHAGLLLALALERLGLQCAVIDAQSVEATLGAPFGGRALALMYGSKRVFEALGLWARLAQVAEPIRSVTLEDRSTGTRIAYEAAAIVDHPFGYGIETRALRRLLLELVLERPAIAVMAPARLAGLERRCDHIAAQTRRRPLPGGGADRRRRRARLDGAHARRPGRQLAAVWPDRTDFRAAPRPAA